MTLNTDQIISLSDPLNFCITKIQLYFNEMKLSDATGFFYKTNFGSKPAYWLVSNWHVFSGRNTENLKILHKDGALPNRFTISVPIKTNQSDYSAEELSQGIFKWADFEVKLYDVKGKARWRQHHEKNKFDVAAITLGAMDAFHIDAINDIAANNDMSIEIGNDVFILGYPLGFSHFMYTPIWKKGSIASDPNLNTEETNERFMLDATTRSGMSGAPVIMRAKTHYISEGGSVKMHLNATRWIGVYASRPSFQPVTDKESEELRAEIGYSYKIHCVNSIIQAGIDGPTFESIGTGDIQ